MQGCVVIFTLMISWESRLTTFHRFSHSSNFTYMISEPFTTNYILLCLGIKPDSMIQTRAPKSLWGESASEPSRPTQPKHLVTLINIFLMLMAADILSRWVHWSRKTLDRTAGLRTVRGTVSSTSPSTSARPPSRQKTDTRSYKNCRTMIYQTFHQTSLIHKYVVLQAFTHTHRCLFVEPHLSQQHAGLHQALQLETLLTWAKFTVWHSILFGFKAVQQRYDSL